MKNSALFILLFILLIAAFIIDLMIGSANIPFSEICNVFTGDNNNIIYNEIILNHRLPKAITAVLAGGALSIAGVLMQTMFHNPLAGPDVLGVTSGSSLGVALLLWSTLIGPLRPQRKDGT